MNIEEKITSLIDVALKLDLTRNEKVDQVVNALTLQEWREFGWNLVYERLAYAEDAVALNKQYPAQVIPIHRAEIMVVREASHDVQRISDQDAERKALAMLRAARTYEERLAATVGLKSHSVRLGDGTEVPFHEGNEEQLTQRAKMFGKQIRGMMDSRELLEGIVRIIREAGVTNLREAEEKLATEKLAGNLVAV